MPTRFVILHHRLDDGEHWDLMIEHGDVLWTWQLQRNPFAPGPWPIAARRIGDHRKAYLEYEGPISRNRGHVTRIESGTAKFTTTCSDCYALHFTGNALTGEFSLTQTAGDDWLLKRENGTPQA